MRSTAIDRRSALAGLAGGFAWPLIPAPVRAAASAPLFLSARADRHGSYLASAFDRDGKAALDCKLPGRGHSFAVHGGRRLAVLFARRPGTYAVVYDLAHGKAVCTFHSRDDRHFYGHGVFAPDGRLLYAAENDFDGQRGVIGVYETDNGFARIGELPSHDIGPHEITLLNDGVTLAAANGGILTHPDMPRVKLNLPAMTPSLTYIDRRDGRLVERIRLGSELRQASIRHVAVNAAGKVAFAMQYEGPAGDFVPLVGVHRPGSRPRLFDAPKTAIRAMRQYCGATVFDVTGTVIAASSPRGGVATFWETATGRHLLTVPVADGCGIAPAGAPGRFLASSGRGGVFVVDARSGAVARIASDFLDRAAWDNHIVPTMVPVRA
jgi:hypothetical protein